MSESPQWVFYGDDELHDALHELVPSLGNKGVSLHLLRRAGCHVPAWFTISTAASRHYWQAQQWPAELWPQVQQGVRRLEAATGMTFAQGPNPLRLAVRSGAAVSMPGAMDTILNCGWNSELITSLPPLAQDSAWRAYAEFIIGLAASRYGLALPAVDVTQSTEHPRAICERLLAAYESLQQQPFPDDPWTGLSESIVGVWQSWQSTRARAFRRSVPELHALSGTAVTIQVMADVDAAGVMFTRGTEDATADATIIEAIFGSGRRLVTGEVTPHRYVISRRSGSICSTPSYEARDPSVFTATPPLTESQAGQLAAIGVRLEQQFGEPLDVEWGILGDQWIFFQARSIICDQIALRIADLRAAEIQKLKQSAEQHSHVWVRHPLSETLPAPTPLTWDVMRRFLSGDGGYGRLYRELGYEPSAKICEHGLLQLIAGRLYVDPQNVTELFAAGWPWRYDIEQLRRDPSVLERGPTHFDERRIDETFLLRMPRLLRVMYRARWRTSRLSARVRDDFEHRFVPALRTFVHDERQKSFATLTTGQLVELYHLRCRRVLDEFGPASLLPGLFGGLAFADLQRELIALLGKAEGEQLARDLVTGLESEHITLRDEMLLRVARHEIPLASFLDEFGHRAVHELELAVPRWREDTEAVEQLITWFQEHSLEDLTKKRERARQNRLRHTARLPDVLAEAGGRSFLSKIRDLLWHASELLPYRETGKHYFLQGYELIRQVLCELGRRHGWTDEIFFCRESELPLLASEPPPWLHSELLVRRRDWQLLQRIDLPDFIESDQLDRLSDARPELTHVAHSFPATVLSPGSARGQALILETDDLRHAPAISSGYILICDSLDPGLTPLLASAKGLVVARGGTLSHGAVVARQLGVPALACPDAIPLVRYGDRLVIDGEQQKLHIEHSHA